MTRNSMSPSVPTQSLRPGFFRYLSKKTRVILLIALAWLGGAQSVAFANVQNGLSFYPAPGAPAGSQRWCLEMQFQDSADLPCSYRPDVIIEIIHLTHQVNGYYIPLEKPCEVTSLGVEFKDYPGIPIWPNSDRVEAQKQLEFLQSRGLCQN